MYVHKYNSEKDIVIEFMFLLNRYLVIERTNHNGLPNFYFVIGKGSTNLTNYDPVNAVSTSFNKIILKHML